MKLSDLKAAPYNPRRISDEALGGLKHSEKRFGDISGIVFNKRSRHLIAGHQRIRALRDLYGDLRVIKDSIHTPDGGIFAVRIVDWDAKKEKAANVAANASTISGEFTPDISKILEDIKLESPEDYAALLFDGIDVPHVAQSDVIEDEAPEPPKVARTVKGDLYELGSHRLLCGDSTNADDVAKMLGAVVPMLMVTDPPYGVDYDPDWRNRADRANGKPYGARAIGEVSNDDKNDWRGAWSLFGGDVVYVWHAGRHAKSVQESLEICGFEIRNQIIWAKNRFVISRGNYHWQHEPCWYAVRKGKGGNWAGDRSQTTLWNIGHNKSETGHSTQKPVECMSRPIQNNSSAGQAVYDPFLGSGTTMIAAEQLGRSCYGMEIDPKYCDVIVQRWCNFTGKNSVKLNGKEIDWQPQA